MKYCPSRKLKQWEGSPRQLWILDYHITYKSHNLSVSNNSRFLFPTITCYVLRKDRSMFIQTDSFPYQEQSHNWTNPHLGEQTQGGERVDRGPRHVMSVGIQGPILNQNFR